MGKTAFLFAGQGSQYTGMGKELYDGFKSARQVYDNGSNLLDFDVRALCFDGPEEELCKTEFTQPAMLTTACAITAVLQQHGLEADYAAGLSLGEYSALVYAGVMNFEDGLKLIRKRGQLMQSAVPAGKGAMAAILGLDDATVKNYCESINGGILEVANYNCPGQIVITGERPVVEQAAIALKEQGAMKTVLLNVSGPFHSSMMDGAAHQLEKALIATRFHGTDKSVLSNFDNEFYDQEKCNIIYKLKHQICSPVRWEDNVRKLISTGVDTFIEIGPGKALSAFMKKIDKSRTVYPVEDMKSLEKLLAQLNAIKSEQV